MKLIVIDIQKGITDERLYDIAGFLKNVTSIIDLCFKGIEAGRNPEIGYGILEEYRGQGFATEAVKLALKWSFRHPGIKAVEAEADTGNAASQRVLLKCGFRPNGEIGEEGPRYRVYGGNEMNTNDYTIRSEREEEYRAVENLVRESFWNVYRPGCSEHSGLLFGESGRNGLRCCSF